MDSTSKARASPQSRSKPKQTTRKNCLPAALNSKTLDPAPHAFVKSCPIIPCPKSWPTTTFFLSISILTIKNCPSHPPMAPEPRIASIATTALWRKPYRKLLDSITSPAMAPPTVTLSTSGTTGGMNPSGNRKRVRSLKSVLAPTWCFFWG